MQVSVVSGTYNRLPLLKRMVESARQSIGGLDYEIILVDGGSTDGTIEWCEGQEDIKLIEQGELLGAIEAFNAGAETARGQYVALLNDDVTVNSDTIAQAYRYLQANPDVGMVAFKSEYPRRSQWNAPAILGAFGYHYGQCCMLRRWLGDLAGWWGNEGMRTYGGDTRLSLRLWEMGWPTVPVAGCGVTDHDHQDELREINSDTPWRMARKQGKIHPDLVIFNRAWEGRMPKRGNWIAAPIARPGRRVLEKAARGNLRTIRFKAAPQGRPRTALIDAFGKYGPTEQIDQNALVRKHETAGFQGKAEAIIQQFQPDLVVLQAQRGTNFAPETVWRLREKWPWIFWLNFDGDMHLNMEETQFYFEIARAVHLQCVVSPTLFPLYAAHGVGVAYWPIGIEAEYVRERGPVTGPDVVFLGALYGVGVFPEAEMRRDAVVALAHSGLALDLYGNGWSKVGLKSEYTGEDHIRNAALYAGAKMALSVSQSKDWWGYTSNRLYQICATGCPALVQRFAGMEARGFVDDETCIAWATPAEMLEKARYYADHDAERECIGAAGREMTLSRHTWGHRVEALWEMIGGLV